MLQKDGFDVRVLLGGFAAAQNGGLKVVGQSVTLPQPGAVAAPASQTSLAIPAPRSNF